MLLTFHVVLGIQLHIYELLILVYASHPMQHQVVPSAFHYDMMYCTYTHTDTHTQTYIHTYIQHTHTRTYTYTYIHIHTHTCTHI